MNRRNITTVILMAIGLFMLTCAVTFKTSDSPSEILDGRNEATDFIPSVIGALALVGGVALLIGKPKSV